MRQILALFFVSLWLLSCSQSPVEPPAEITETQAKTPMDKDNDSAPEYTNLTGTLTQSYLGKSYSAKVPDCRLSWVGDSTDENPFASKALKFSTHQHTKDYPKLWYGLWLKDRGAKPITVGLVKHKESESLKFGVAMDMGTGELTVEGQKFPAIYDDFYARIPDGEVGLREVKTISLSATLPAVIIRPGEPREPVDISYTFEGECLIGISWLDRWESQKPQ